MSEPTYNHLSLRGNQPADGKPRDGGYFDVAASSLKKPVDAGYFDVAASSHYYEVVNGGITIPSASLKPGKQMLPVDEPQGKQMLPVYEPNATDGLDGLTPELRAYLMKSGKKLSNILPVETNMRKPVAPPAPKAPKVSITVNAPPGCNVSVGVMFNEHNHYY